MTPGELTATEARRAHCGARDDGSRGVPGPRSIESPSPTTLHAFQLVSSERALDSARRLDSAQASGTVLGPLDWLARSFALKDNMSTRGVAMMVSPRILQTSRPPYSATVTQKLEAAGAGSSQNQSRRVRDGLFHGELPRSARRQIPGTLSARRGCAEPRLGGRGGGANGACRAEGPTPRIDSSTAALSGIVGLKPTYGRVSRYGLLAFACRSIRLGPLTRSVADAALLLEVIAGADPYRFNGRTGTSAELSRRPHR